MTARQLLHEYVESLSEEEAAETAALLIPGRDRPLTEYERRVIEVGLAQIDAGEEIPLEEVEREFGLR